MMGIYYGALKPHFNGMSFFLGQTAEGAPFIISNWSLKRGIQSDVHSEVMLQCSLVVGKKSAAYQMKPHLKELCFCRTPRPSAAYPGSPSWTCPGFLSCTLRSASPRQALPPALGLKRCKKERGKTKEGKRRNFSFNRDVRIFLF